MMVCFFSRLLDILAGRKDPSGLQGQILFDGVPPPDNFKCMVGYVVQVGVILFYDCFCVF